MNWTRCFECAPNEAGRYITYIMCFSMNANGKLIPQREIVILKWDGLHWRDGKGSRMLADTVLYWMPLPEAPPEETLGPLDAARKSRQGEQG